MKMSSSSKNVRGAENVNAEPQNPLKKNIKKRISLQDDNIKKDIYKKLNEGTVLNFIRFSNKRETSKSNFSENPKEMKYDLCMLNKYEEDLNSSLSFISDFDLENEGNENDDSFNSSFDDNSVEEIDIISKRK